MSETRENGSEPRPFEDRPVTPASFSGCGKPLVIGCTAVLVVLAVGLLVVVWKAGDLVEWSLGQYRDTVLEHLPEDVTPAERERLVAAFDAAVAAVTEGRADPAGLQDLQRAMSATGRKIQNLTREDVLELTLALERVAGVEREPEPEAAPAPARLSGPPGPRASPAPATAA